MNTQEKPHKGKIENWYKAEVPANYGLGFVVRGLFVEHEDFKGFIGHTSYVVKHDEVTGEIETRNSRYTLVGESVH